MAEKANKQTVYSSGIYHGLPGLTSGPNGLTAVVTGANGISGAHMVSQLPLTRSFHPCVLIRDSQIRVLSQSPERWTKIYALSRRPPSGQWPKTVEHIPLDFLKSPEEIADILQERSIKPDYIFWFAYILVTDRSGALQWGDDRLINRNSKPHQFTRTAVSGT